MDIIILNLDFTDCFFEIDLGGFNEGKGILLIHKLYKKIINEYINISNQEIYIEKEGVRILGKILKSYKPGDDLSEIKGLHRLNGLVEFTNTWPKPANEYYIYILKDVEKLNLNDSEKFSTIFLR